MGYGIPLPTWLVKNTTLLLEGLSSLKLLYHAFSCVRMFAYPGCHPRGQQSQELLISLKGQTAGGNIRAVVQQPAGEFMFSNGMEITKHKPITKCFLSHTPLSHSHPVVSSLMLKFPRNPKPRLYTRWLGFKGICPTHSAERLNPSGTVRAKALRHGQGTGRQPVEFKSVSKGGE